MDVFNNLFLLYSPIVSGLIWFWFLCFGFFVAVVGGRGGFVRFFCVGWVFLTH